ncbi:glutathione S-transferase family protein [Sinorhizobium meliloti]|jgi:putative glutathione S-transferase|uniref:glutathione S-transferase family protein n=1 Tax=Rhizobium meliloti TaxID=382 RepID=UPI000D1F3C45|nr:glutathione S-transferase family protein [Sinorhizobium meliloti]MDW9414048.1 glutathione S-transferase family protein [Sinorhizobium meliloti]MDW9481463.1 glutathione S-transferase family protein [Sinorhizobium meliloti]MDW9511315.1 glutathione S-transferase family protein [Sinorhizobium meliloti]MDW9635398.1 glutathione S-transferase family protein [Sinorhizobium meliloti]MDW9667359.1 glutathione S-transferase family protein [Sinorhizobium meliloti]
MGRLVNGVWQDVWYDTRATNGHFKRSESQFRNWITADGSPGPSGEGGFEAEAGRYHLYVSLACPWAHRTLIFRKLKKLEDLISLSVVDPLMLANGWEFKGEERGGEDRGGENGGTADHLFGSRMLWEVYLRADPVYSGRVTVPVLWDKRKNTIVSNESAEIIRMFNSAFDRLTGSTEDFCPQELRPEIDALNARIYDAVNNGVYKAGFATSQAAYEESVTALFAMLEELENRLASKRYLTGDRLTEADWRLFTTLVRFDPVYVGHFKCNIRRIADYPNLYGYLRELYQVPGVAETVNMHHIKAHYYRSHTTINPTGIVPVGPALDLEAPHGRDSL